jgi:hypothetical protein
MLRCLHNVFNDLKKVHIAFEIGLILDYIDTLFAPIKLRNGCQSANLNDNKEFDTISRHSLHHTKGVVCAVFPDFPNHDHQIGELQFDFKDECKLVHAQCAEQLQNVAIFFLLKKKIAGKLTYYYGSNHLDLVVATTSCCNDD